MIAIIIIIVLVLLVMKYPQIKYCFLHPIKTIRYGFKDIKEYIVHKGYNVCNQYGKMVSYCASGQQVFGCGKTLTMVHDAINIYRKYDNLPVWNYKENKYVIQHVHIVSNVDMSGSGIPYYKWTDESMLSHFEKFGFPEQDITIFLLDEASSVFNSRSFKTNFSEVLLSILLQQRKYKMCIFTTAQRFSMIDKLIRETTSSVVTCKKIWRLIFTCTYDAYDVENCDNMAFLQPLSTRVWFAKDSDYNAYDTTQHVEKLQKINDEGGFLSTAEIINARGETDTDVNKVSNKKRKKLYRKY